MVAHIKMISIVVFILTLSSCTVVGDYYVLTEADEDTVVSILYRDENIFVHLHHFDGNISRLTIYNQSNEKNLDVKLLKIDHSLFASNNTQIPSLSRDDTQDISNAIPDSPVLYKITQVYKVDDPLNRVTEHINIELLVNKMPINISKKFSLKRKTYNHLQALWDI